MGKHDTEVQEHYSYGCVYLERGETDRALSEFRQAHELDNTDPEVLIGMARCFLEEQKVEEAAKLLETALSNAPQFADAHYHLGRAYEQLNRREKAINEFKESLNINPRYVAARRHLSILMRDMEESARQTAEPVRERSDVSEEQISKQANIHFHMGNALFQKNMLQEALLEYKESIRLRPNYPDVRNRMGELHLRRGHYNLAEEEFLISLKINPKFVTAMLNIAETYRLHSEHLMDKAEAEYQRVMENDPQNSKASRGLEIIRSIKNIDFV